MLYALYEHALHPLLSTMSMPCPSALRTVHPMPSITFVFFMFFGHYDLSLYLFNCFFDHV